jgi:uncharacterized protein (TIGR02611 family)
VLARVEPLLQVLGRAVKRGGVFLVGTALLIAGAAMLVLPGPGIAVMFLGLVVLSAEFQWAHRILAWARDRGRSLKDQAQSRMPGANRHPPDGPPTRDRPDRAA